MATERLVIAVDERGSRVVQRNIRGIGTASRSAQGGVQLLRRALGAIGGALIIRELIRLSDSFTRVENAARIVSDGVGDVNETVSRLFDIANRTRAPVEALTAVFQRGSLAAKELGASQEDLFKFTELVGQGLAVQGTSAEAARGALQQLSQALGSSIVRGEEFNSILEGAFPLAQAAARGLDRAGGSVARLRTLVIQGKVTNVEFFNALLSQADELASLFARTNPTISQSFEVLRNAATQVIGEFNQATGAALGLARGLINVGTFIKENSTNFANFGKALTGTLGPTDNLTRAFTKMAIAILTIRTQLIILKDSILEPTKLLFRSVADVVGAGAAGLVAALEGNFEGARTVIGDAVAGIGEDAVQTFQDLNKDIRLEITDLIDNIDKLFDPAARTVEDFTNTIKEAGGADIPLPPAIDLAVQRLGESLQDLQVDLVLEEAAMRIAAETGQEYSEVLEDLLIRTKGAAAGEELLAENIIVTLNRIRELTAVQDRFNEIMEEGIALTEALRDPQEVFNDTLSNLIFLYDEGAIGAQTYARAVLEAQRTMIDDSQIDEVMTNLTTFLTRARENAQDILGDALADVFTGGLDDIPAQFARVLLELSSQFLASEIFKLLGNLGSGGGAGGGGDGAGGILSAIGGFFAGGFQTGGSFQVPGSGGPDSQLVSLMATPRETVTISPQGQQGGGGPAPVVNVAPPQVIVVDSAEKARALLNGPEGENAVLLHLRNNQDTVRGLS